MGYTSWILLLLACAVALAAPVAAVGPQPVPAWNATFGGSDNEYAAAMQQTADGGSVLAGYTTSDRSGDVGPTNGGHDFWVVKLDSAGQMTWNTPLGGNATDVAFAVEQTTDGGYVVAGMTSSNQSGDVGLNHGGTDAWVVRLDGAGQPVWNRTLGGNGHDLVSGVQQTADGGYVLAGTTDSDRDGDVGPTHGAGDCWVVKLDAAGQMVWNAALGGSGYDSARAVRQTADGGYIVAGYTDSNQDGDVGLNHGGRDAWVLRLDPAGRVAWSATLGGSELDSAAAVEQTADGGYVVAGETESSESGDVGPTRGNADYWVLKLDAAGQLAWNTTLGGSGRDEAYAVQPTGDGGCVVAGESSSRDGDIGFNHGSSDCWVVGLDGAGRQVWNATLGGSGDDIAFAVQPTSDGYVVAGSTDSSGSGDVGLNHGGTDYWVVKLANAARIVALPGCAAPPTSTNADGLCDDVNGNGRADFADVALFFNQMTWIAENEPMTSFDYNANGRIDFADAVWLFNNL